MTKLWLCQFLVCCASLTLTCCARGQATVVGERQPAGARGEGEHGEEAPEPHQRGAAVASADGRAQPSHVAERLARPPVALSARLARPPELLPPVTQPPHLLQATLRSALDSFFFFFFFKAGENLEQRTR